MPRHEGILRNAPVIVEHTQVTVADPKMLDVDRDFIRLQWLRIIFKKFECSNRSVCGICFDYNSSKLAQDQPTSIDSALI